MAEVFFFLAAIGAIAGAVGTVSLRNPFYAVLALVCHLLALAALFLLLRAEFVAAAQVVVYAGAVMVLYVFVVAYVGAEDQPTGRDRPLGGSRLRPVAVLACGALFVELCIAVLGSGIAALSTEGTGIAGTTGKAADTGFGTAAEMGRLFLTKFLVAFEVASLLLLIAAVGAVILARRRSGLDDPREISVGDVMRGDAGTRIDAPTESMLEAGGPANR